MAQWQLYGKRTGRTRKQGITIDTRATLTIPKDILRGLGIGETCDLHIGVGESNGPLAVSSGESRKLSTTPGSLRMHLRAASLLADLGYSSDNPPAQHPHYEIADGMLIIAPRRERGN